MTEKIAVLSDTHIPARADDLPFDVLKAMEEVNLVLHAGDLTVSSVFDRLNDLAPLKAVRGNMDDEGLRVKLPLIEQFEFGGLRWGMTHGTGGPDGIIERIQKLFSDQLPQLVIFGHTHQPLIEQRGECVFFNPGSPTDTVYAPYRSWGYIEIESGTISRMEIVGV